MTMTPRSSLLETRLDARASAERQSELRTIEAALLKIHLRADSIEDPVLTYLINMAIAEVRGMTPVDQETPASQEGRTPSNVIKFADSFESRLTGSAVAAATPVRSVCKHAQMSSALSSGDTEIQPEAAEQSIPASSSGNSSAGQVTSVPSSLDVYALHLLAEGWRWMGTPAI